MSLLDAALAAAIGVAAGVLSGLFGVGGGIVMTPGIQLLLGTSGIVALATPLPVILPTAVAGALAYRRAGSIDVRAAGWMIAGGLPTSALGAVLTEVVETPLLLLVTAALLAWQAVGILRGARRSVAPRRARPWTAGAFVLVGVVAGLVSGLLGIGGGIVIVPLLVGWLGMPLKRALGTSLAAIVGMVVPGTVVHAVLGNVDWALTVALVAGAVPGARLGARIALGTAERTLRILVGVFMALVAISYAARQVADLVGG
ncbi:MAG TPA: sulfite exporter TauE/SafE family protein [Actinomycetota bacterium]